MEGELSCCYLLCRYLGSLYYSLARPEIDSSGGLNQFLCWSWPALVIGYARFRYGLVDYARLQQPASDMSFRYSTIPLGGFYAIHFQNL